jgi:hypothetical protein
MSEKIFIYIDDLWVHYLKHFSLGLWKQAFPSHMVLNWNKDDDGIRTYLDLAISMRDNRVIYTTYQKAQNAYTYPHADSDIPNSVRFAFIKGEIIRYLRTNKQFEDWLLQKSKFKLRLIARGYRLNYINSAFKTVTWSDKEKYSDFSAKTKSRPLVWKKRWNANDHQLLNLMGEIREARNLLPKDWDAPNMLLCHLMAPSYGNVLIRSNINEFGVFGENRNENGRKDTDMTGSKIIVCFNPNDKRSYAVKFQEYLNRRQQTLEEWTKETERQNE